MALKQPEIIEVPDDDDFPDSGPQNPVEAQSYRDKLDAIMNTFSDLLVDDHKDTLRSTITSLKKLMVKHWWQMAEAMWMQCSSPSMTPVASIFISISPPKVSM